MSRVLAVFASEEAGSPATTEWLRVLVALVAVGHEVALVEAGPGQGVLSAEPPGLDDEGERHLTALLEEGVLPRPVRDLAAAIAAAEGVLVLGSPERPKAPSVFAIGRGQHLSAQGLSTVFDAGVVVLE